MSFTELDHGLNINATVNNTASVNISHGSRSDILDQGSWICCQMGGREHYAIPRALYRDGALSCLITDAWVRPESVFNRLPGRRFSGIRNRFHSELADASVYAFTPGLLGFEILKRILNLKYNELSIARNVWYQDRALRVLRNIEDAVSGSPTLFSYSYGALKLFRYAKERGWRTILGQIDPGQVDEALILEEHSRYRQYRAVWRNKPPQYWKDWEEECLLADKIIVNSSWSGRTVRQAGIPDSKIEIIPLAYQGGHEADHFIRSYPEAYDRHRPLRILYLGQITLRKGVAAVLDAAVRLSNAPVEFRMVGPRYITLPNGACDNLKWLGAVPRDETAHHYRDADVFLFPTLSDGFGLTQLEAQSWKLPVIASRCCGEVVTDNANGILLDEVSGESIADAVRKCLDNPGLLQRYSESSVDMREYSLDMLRCNLRKLV